MQGSTSFPKRQELPPNSRCQNGDMKQVPFQGPKLVEQPVNVTVIWHFCLVHVIWYTFLYVKKRTAVTLLKMLGITVQNIVIRVTRCPAFVHRWSDVKTVSCYVWKSYLCAKNLEGSAGNQGRILKHASTPSILFSR